MSEENKYVADWTTKNGEHKKREYTATQRKQLFCKANHLIIRHLWQHVRKRTVPRIYEGILGAAPGDQQPPQITVDRYNRTLNYGTQHYTPEELDKMYATTGIPRICFTGEDILIRDYDFLELCYQLFELRSARIKIKIKGDDQETEDNQKTEEQKRIEEQKRKDQKKEREALTKQYEELEKQFNDYVDARCDNIQNIGNPQDAFEAYCYFLRYSKKIEWQNSEKFVIDGMVRYINDIKFDDVNQCTDDKRCKALAKILREKLDMVEAIMKYRELDDKNQEQQQQQNLL